MKTFKVPGNDAMWTKRADLAARVLRTIDIGSGRRFTASVTGIASVTTDADVRVVDAVLTGLLRSTDFAVCVAFTMAYLAHGNIDDAARTAVIAGGPGSECVGHFAQWRHGVRSRIRWSDAHGTTTDHDASAIARGAVRWKHLSGWQSHVILDSIWNALGWYRYDALCVSRHQGAGFVVAYFTERGHRAWISVHEGFFSGLQVVAPTATRELAHAAYAAMPRKIKNGGAR